MPMRRTSLAVVGALLLVTFVFTGGASAGSVDSVLTFQQVRTVRCGAGGAVADPYDAGSCVRPSGHVVLGPGAFVLARRVPKYAEGVNAGKLPRGAWVEVVLLGRAKAEMTSAVADHARARYGFVFNGRELRADVGGDGVSVFLLPPDARTARRIVALVCHRGCDRPFPGPTG